MRRGEIVTVTFDPGRGAEASKTRPAVIVSNDAANATGSNRRPSAFQAPSRRCRMMLSEA
jgi:mRNA-degrading endonuclease toxin of MazEF toxin-antitoxin module